MQQNNYTLKFPNTVVQQHSFWQFLNSHYPKFLDKIFKFAMSLSHLFYTVKLRLFTSIQPQEIPEFTHNQHSSLEIARQFEGSPCLKC